MNLLTKPESKFFMGLIAISLLIVSTTIGSAMATSPWHIGGAKLVQSNTNELNADVNGVTPPGPNAISATTLYWIGGSSVNGYLVQPELRAWTSTYWKGFFETVRPTGTTLDIYQTSLNVFNGDNVEMDVKLQSTSLVCMYIKKGTTTVSKCFTSANYGSTFCCDADAQLESYAHSSSDFAPMGSPIQFTDFRGYKTDGSTYVISPTAFTTGSNPPSCITSSTGTGTVTITENC